MEKVETEREFHAIANLFPMLAPDEFDELKADIEANGLHEPIWVLAEDGSIIDGRNRYVACRELGIEPDFRIWDGAGSLVAFVVSLNLRRRHLNSSQCAMVAVDMLPMLEAEAEVRMLAGVEADPTQRIGEGSKHAGESAAQAAAIVGTNRQYVSDAKKLATEDPESAEQVRSGKKTLPEVKRQKKEERKEQHRAEAAEADAALPPTEQLLGNAKFSTIVIDPPWDFRDEGDDDVYGRTRPDYHQMSIKGIQTIPIDEYADEDCHLYLWITNRSMYKGFDLLERWGFRFITILTWCKPSIGVGNYFRNNTEHVLFGVKGSQLLKRKDVGTWFEAKRGPRGHSSKPTEFIDLVESCSHGPYLEWFARLKKDEDRDGWKYLSGVEADN